MSSGQDTFWSVVLLVVKMSAALVAVVFAGIVVAAIWVARLFGRFLLWLVPPLGRPL